MTSAHLFGLALVAMTGLYSYAYAFKSGRLDVMNGSGCREAWLSIINLAACLATTYFLGGLK